MERRIIVSLSGREGERLIAARYDHRGADRDYKNALDSVDSLVPSNEEATAYFRWLEVRARQLIRAPHVRPAIDAVAGALLARETIRRAELSRLITNALRERDAP